jgi:hypothetical protein
MRFQQAVYGSFPFWNRGYGVLAHSPGCRPEWLAELRTVCQRYGEPPSGTPDVEGLFALRLESGPWLVAGVRSQGSDDLGRPGALAFHALFVRPTTQWLLAGNPFAFENEIRRDWSLDDCDRALPAGQLRLEFGTRPTGSAGDDREHPQLPAILAALAQRRRVIVQSSKPIDALARSIWRNLPVRARIRASVATWAFDIANGFDLVALPKLSGLVLDPSDLIVALEPSVSVAKHTQSLNRPVLDP